MPVEFRSLVVPRHGRVAVVGDPARATQAWLILHGYGMLAQGILHWFRGAERTNRLLVAPEGLSRFYVEDKGTRRVGASWLTRDDRENEIADMLGYLDQVVSEVIGPITELEVHGFSQGFSTGARWAAHTDRWVQRLVGWAGRVPEDVSIEALQRALQGRPLDLVVGNDDQRVLPEQIQADAERLRASGLHVIVHQVKGGHRVDEQVLSAFSGLEAEGEPAE